MKKRRPHNGNTSWWYAIRKWFLALPNNWLRSWLIRRDFIRTACHVMSDTQQRREKDVAKLSIRPSERAELSSWVEKCAKIGSVGKKINFVMHHHDVQCSARFHNWMNLHFKCRLAHTWTLALVNRSLVRSACKNVSRGWVAGFWMERKRSGWINFPARTKEVGDCSLSQGR